VGGVVLEQTFVVQRLAQVVVQRGGLCGDQDHRLLTPVPIVLGAAGQQVDQDRRGMAAVLLGDHLGGADPGQ